uniref:Three-finger toxin n=1 Tax=Calliophis bivirgatus TaxID=8633 RepID=A0A898IPN0_CALBG|nr:three-finger toxin [Calliophis bivirgatus]
MKTLLLTLVVVTIVCLDLGHTRECYQGDNPKTIVTCPKGHHLCYKKTYTNPKRTIRGCASRCPTDYSCCAANKCNK